MIVYDDNERLMNIKTVFYLTLRMDIYNKNSNDVKNNDILKRFIGNYSNSLKETDQFLLNEVYNYLGYKPEQRYKITEIKNLYEKL